MDKKGTQSETLSNKILTSVRSGTVCRLVGISDQELTRGSHGSHRHRGWGERQHGHHWFRPGFQKKHSSNGAGILRRLLDLGLTKGCLFKVVQGSGAGPILVEVRGTRVALGHGIARRLIVEELEATSE
ncbi:MAG: ferrous iron transport protein A [Candidatus Odinarchaeota archaeon]